jgi:hypothetical protein
MTEVGPEKFHSTFFPGLDGGKPRGMTQKSRKSAHNALMGLTEHDDIVGALAAGGSNLGAIGLWRRGVPTITRPAAAQPRLPADSVIGRRLSPPALNNSPRHRTKTLDLCMLTVSVSPD